MMVRVKENYTLLLKVSQVPPGSRTLGKDATLVRQSQSQVPRVDWRVPGLEPWLQQHFDELSKCRGQLSLGIYKFEAKKFILTLYCFLRKPNRAGTGEGREVTDDIQQTMTNMSQVPGDILQISHPPGKMALVSWGGGVASHGRGSLECRLNIPQISKVPLLGGLHRGSGASGRCLDTH